MKVQIELDMTEQEARVLRSWASVGRFMDSVDRLADKIIEGETITSKWEQDAIAVQEDAATLKQSLSNVHYQLRAKLVDLGVKPLWPQLAEEVLEKKHVD